MLNPCIQLNLIESPFSGEVAVTRTVLRGARSSY